MRLDEVTGALLAGGAGRRLGGVRKALLNVGGGVTILDRSLGLMRELFPAAIVIANEPEPYAHAGAPIVGDPIPGKGAPGGLLAALEAAKTPWVFLLACDMPLVEAKVIRALASHVTPDTKSVIAIRDGRPEPLHAFWSTTLAPRLSEMLRTGDPSFRDLLAEIPHVRVPVDELGDGAARTFSSVNTPEDLAALGVSH